MTNKEGNNFSTEAQSASWSRELRGNASTLTKECGSDIFQFRESLEAARFSRDAGINAIFPIIGSYGVNRIDNDYRKPCKSEIRESRLVKAYRSVLRDKVDFKHAYNWLYRYNSNLAKDREFEGTREALLNALYESIPYLSEIAIDTKKNEFAARVSLPGSSSVYQSFEDMSDGLKSWICILADLAYRCVLLNGFLGLDAVKKTPGIVVINHLELYLHPYWQKHILSDLMRAFPMIQFFISTNSPFIIQSVYNKNIITLDGKKGSSDPFKRSIEDVAISEMGLETLRSERFNKMVECAEEYFQLISQSKGESESAKAIKRRLDEIEEEFSDDPAYVALLKIERKSKSKE